VFYVAVVLLVLYGVARCWTIAIQRAWLGQYCAEHVTQVRVRSKRTSRGMEEVRIKD
jgi:hypothetical protein